MAFLLDTNAWIGYLKSPTSKIQDRLKNLNPGNVFVCSVVKAELFHGALKYGNPERRMAILQELFAPYASAPFDDRAALAYGAIRHELEIRGQVIGPHDLMIAAIAKVNGLTLVTENQSEFGRVANLRMENWQS